MATKKKSPINAAPLRSAGESIRDQQFKLIEGSFFWALLFAGFLGAMTISEWIRYWNLSPPQPWPYTVVFIIAVAFATYKTLSVRKQMLRLRMARDGERAVGEFLEKLRADGYQVFHDLVGDGFNLDHVLIGPAGVFTIETKTYSKPEKGKAEITFDGKSIKIGRWAPPRNPVIQARAQVGWLSSLLKETTGRDFPVHPVIVFPGWFIRTTDKPTKPIWVLEPKALPKYLKNQQTRLSKEEISLASYHLSRFIRVEEGRRRGR